MYKKFINIIILSLVATTLFAQQNAPKSTQTKVSRQKWQQQMTEKKRLYFVEKMNLTETESAAFTTLFNKYEEEIRASHRKIFKAFKECEANQTEDSYNNFINIITTEKKYQGEREAEFINSLKKIMSTEKVFKYCDAEREFKMLMMKEVQPAPKVQK